jgi:hypothetical protein
MQGSLQKLMEKSDAPRKIEININNFYTYFCADGRPLSLKEAQDSHSKFTRHILSNPNRYTKEELELADRAIEYARKNVQYIWPNLSRNNQKPTSNNPVMLMLPFMRAETNRQFKAQEEKFWFIAGLSAVTGSATIFWMFNTYPEDISKKILEISVLALTAYSAGAFSNRALIMRGLSRVIRKDVYYQEDE